MRWSAFMLALGLATASLSSGALAAPACAESLAFSFTVEFQPARS